MTWQQADAQRLDFPQASFDLVMCSFGAMFFPDRRAAFGEVLRFIARVPHGYTDPATISADLHAAGLSDLTIGRVVLSGTAASARWLAEGFCMGTPLRFALEARGSLQDLMEAVADDMSTRPGDGTLTGDLAAFVVDAKSPA